MKNLLIIGARGFGREVFDMVKDCRGYGTDFAVKGFLDDKKDALDGFSGYPSIVSSPEDYEFTDDDVFFVAMGDPKWRRHYAELALSKGGSPLSLIHNTAHIGQNTVIGRGCLVGVGVRITVDCTVGDFVTLFYSSDIGHDVHIGDYSHVGAFGFMGGGSSLGSGVTLHPRASLLPHKKVGDNATVGAGSVCIRNVKSGDVVFGVPAKSIN